VRDGHEARADVDGVTDNASRGPEPDRRCATMGLGLVARRPGSETRFLSAPGIPVEEHPDVAVLDHLCRAVNRHASCRAPAGLRPELIPGVEVLEVLPTVNHPAVLEFENDAVGNIEMLAVSVRGAALDAHHTVVTICRYVL
jgi:hypothetical protein